MLTIKKILMLNLKNRRFCCNIKNSLKAISPIDGRYWRHTVALSEFFSEFALIKNRIFTELKWVEKLSSIDQISKGQNFSIDAKTELNSIYSNFNLEDAVEVKNIEKEINHDVKAVEYFIRNKFKKSQNLSNFQQIIHLFCTSEDITNIAYGISLRNGKKLILKKLEEIHFLLKKFCDINKNTSIVSKTHGQQASPTTLGKEFAVFAHRLNKQIKILKNIQIFGKFNGAVGNYNAHHFAFPELDWIKISQQFIEKDIGLQFNPITTQIEPHDMICEIMDALCRINRILIDLCRDSWGYISMGYFLQKSNSKEVGSSTMPHKINPIDFENSEGNLGLANAIMNHFSEKFPISRFQRDLSDSTVLRNLGVGFSHSFLAYDSLLKGLNKLTVNNRKINADLKDSWILLSEPIQTILRLENTENSYEKLKNLTRGQQINQSVIKKYISGLNLPEKEKKKLLELTPEKYTGLAAELTDFVTKSKF